MHPQITIQELAEQILLGGSVADKTVGLDLRLDQVQFIQPEAKYIAKLIAKSVWDIEQPGRVGVLAKWNAAFSDADLTRFPKTSELKLDRGRGKMLHFFANHELLAIESMALTLLKFPDAPIEFRQGVFKTLQDEQRHFLSYLHRMQELGVQLGDHPLNFYFWNSIKTISSPLDFVVRMGLTFEQANLDFALESRQAVLNAGDTVTAQLLQTVHDDEVQHVKHGLKWFRQWRNPAVSEWTAYTEALPFPLNARRARGKQFSVQSRKLAGFTDKFIDSIKVAGGSRGRAPDVYAFFPLPELENQFTVLPQMLLNRTLDLEPLLLWLAKESDVVQLREPVSTEFLKLILHFKNEAAEVVINPTFDVTALSKYSRLGSYRAWGMGPQAWKQWKSFETDRFFYPIQFSEASMHPLFSKVNWAQWLTSSDVCVVNAKQDITENWLQQFPESQEFLFKSEYGMSGRGHKKIRASDRKLFRAEGPGIVEPLLNRIADLSTQAEIFADGSVKFFEPRYFKVDLQFQYQGSYFTAQPNAISDEIIKAVLDANEERMAALESVAKILKAHHYTGPFAVDHFVYEDSVTKKTKFRAICEVNVRFTMGRVALEIEKSLEKKLKRSEMQQAEWRWFTGAAIELAKQNANNPNWIFTTPITSVRNCATAVVLGVV
jgi:uncharacterized ferritin-like protein (DUF455 family)